MDRLSQLLSNIKKLDRVSILLKIYNQAFEKFAIDLNRIDQLYNQGIDSGGNSIGAYAASTVARKRSKGQPTDRVTLKDTGAFYKTFDLIPINTELDFELVADDDGKNLFDRYGADILGWTKENTNEITTYIQTKFYEAVEKQVYNGL